MNWRTQGVIVLAATLIDMRTRFGRTHFSYLVAIGWPFSHILVLIAAYALLHSVAPVGDDPVLFAATGVAPYIICLYPNRMMALTLIQQYYLLRIPAIKPIHLICARLLLEIITVLVVLLLSGVLLLYFSNDAVPLSPYILGTAIGANLLFSVGLGVFNASMGGIFGNVYIIVFLLSMIALYITSGVYIPVSALSTEIQSIAKWNPIYDLIQWSRSAYFLSYDDDTFSKTAVISYSIIFLLLGLLLERFARGKFSRG